jgi:hypothetical protein
VPWKPDPDTRLKGEVACRTCGRTLRPHRTDAYCRWEHNPSCLEDVEKNALRVRFPSAFWPGDEGWKDYASKRAARYTAPVEEGHVPDGR